MPWNNSETQKFNDEVKARVAGDGALDVRVKKLEGAPPPPVDIDADAGDDLRVTVTATTDKSVSYAVNGLDADATAVVTFTDAAGKTQAAPHTTNGAYSIILSALGYGVVSAVADATDAAKNKASSPKVSFTLVKPTQPPLPLPTVLGPIGAMVGPHLSRVQVTALGVPEIIALDTQWDKWEPGDWAEGATWPEPYNDIYSTSSGVYDRSLIYNFMAERDPANAALNRSKAATLANAYIKWAAGFPSEPKQQWFSVAAHALINNDAAAKALMARIGGWVGYQQARGAYADPNFAWATLRVTAHHLAAVIGCHTIKAAGDQGFGGIVSPYGADWLTLLKKMFDDILKCQAADGAFRFQDFSGTAAPYQIGLLNDRLRILHGITGDVRIPASIKKSEDFCWDKMRAPSGESFIYAEGQPGEAPDLNNFHVSSLGFLAEFYRDRKYIDRAIILLRRWNTDAYTYASKQLSEGEFSSHAFPPYYARAKASGLI